MRKLIDRTVRIAASAVLACTLLPAPALAEAASEFSGADDEVTVEQVDDAEETEDSAEAEDATDPEGVTGDESDADLEDLEVSEEELTTEASSAVDNNITVGSTYSGCIPVKAQGTYWPHKEQRWYLTLKNAGCLKIQTTNNSLRGTYMYVRDNDENKYEDTNKKDLVYFDYSSSAGKSTNEYYLNKGNYYIEFSSEKGGSYTFSASFTKSNVTFEETEKGSNNTIGSASQLTLDKKITGQLNNQDDCDIYRLTLSKASTVSFKVNEYFSGAHYAQIYLLDSYGKQLKTQMGDGYVELSMALDKGTYYFKVAPYSPGSGLYTLIATTSSSGSSTSSGTVTMTRLYNKWSGEHLYTSDSAEIKQCEQNGWKNEGTAWKAPASSKTPVYRLYNPYSGDHHYTTSLSEYNECGGRGWRKEGIAWYSDDAKGVPLYRGYNRYVTVGTHHYTSSWTEMTTMVGNSWKYEGVAWYGVK